MVYQCDVMVCVGPLLQEMVTNMQKKIDNKITQNLFIYSGVRWNVFGKTCLNFNFK